ncbi:MAG: signal recognition particle protein [Oscillospiraceae bacterium]|nr:signal recognition particle protein [Oscillospiraceae bacterium]
MAFEGLSEKLARAFKNLRQHGHLTEADVKSAMREIKLALLEADVSFKVVKGFINNVSARCVGSDVLESLTPAQQVVKIVNEELTALMGSETATIKMASNPPTIVMMVGLQGTGKTTQSGKLAGYYKKKGRRPLLVACDVYRPAAITQLEIVGAGVEVPIFKIDGEMNPVKIAKEAVAHAKKHGNDLVLLDTAGRLHIDDALMDELSNIKSAVQPQEILLVVDAMTGQDAVNVAETFNNLLDIDGVVLTKLDGDTRGGAALSVKYITGKPIKFAGIGEKLTDIEPFHPDRMASRILGMGDVLSLIDKAQEAYDEKEALALEEKLRKNRFTLQDFLDQMRQIKKMGPLENLLGMMPGVNQAQLKNVHIDERQIARTEAIILAMTPAEREDPSIMNASRRRRIAAGSGTNVESVNRLLKQFEQMNKMVKQLKSKKGRRRGFGF